jgi:nucleoside-diphosphate-sugar epimerase
MKVMITGAAGFIGTALTKYCSEGRLPGAWFRYP